MEIGDPVDLAVLIVNSLPAEDTAKFPFKEGDRVLCLGEIPSMPLHLAVVTEDGRVHWGYHHENFRKAEDDETVTRA